MKKSPRYDPIAPPQLLGIRNTERPERQPWGACADAADVVVDDTYAIEQREGYQRVAAFTDATDAYSPPAQDGLFVVVDGALRWFGEADPEMIPMPPALVEDLTDTRFAWCGLGDRVFYAGATDCGIVVNGETWQPLRFPVPPFVVTTVTGSGTRAGQYQVTATYVHTASGMEGPAAPIVRVDLADGKTLTVGYAEGYEHPEGYTARFYISECNGSVPYHAHVPLDHQQRDAMPFPDGVTALSAFGGLLHAAVYDATNDISFVHWSRPFYYACWNLAEDYVAVPGKVVALQAMASGVLIITAHGCWLFAEMVLQYLADYGGVAGQSIALDAAGRPWIWTQRGLCTLSAEGWKNITADHVGVPPGNWCATTVLRRRGGDYFIVATDGDGEAANAYGNDVEGTAWCVNLHNGELTRFRNYEFLAFTRLGPARYGLKEGGLYAIGGTTDENDEEPFTPTPVIGAIYLHPTNFGDTSLKRCTYAYLTGCDDSTLTVTPVCDGETVGSYSGRRRIPLARGAKGEFWGFEVSNPYGEPLRLTQLEIRVEPTSRRV